VRLTPLRFVNHVIERFHNNGRVHVLMIWHKRGDIGNYRKRCTKHGGVYALPERLCGVAEIYHEPVPSVLTRTFTPKLFAVRVGSW
jgi:hypothetical protein